MHVTSCGVAQACKLCVASTGRSQCTSHLEWHQQVHKPPDRLQQLRDASSTVRGRTKGTRVEAACVVPACKRAVIKGGWQQHAAMCLVDAKQL